MFSRNSLDLTNFLKGIGAKYDIPVDDWEKLREYKGTCIKVVRWKSPLPTFHLHYVIKGAGTGIATFNTMHRLGRYFIHIRDSTPFLFIDKRYNYRTKSEESFYRKLEKEIEKRLKAAGL